MSEFDQTTHRQLRLRDIQCIPNIMCLVQFLPRDAMQSAVMPQHVVSLSVRLSIRDVQVP